MWQDQTETGLNQNWNRDYDPLIGEYIERDPIGLRGSLDTYAYVGANPLSFVDPEGLYPGMGGATDSCSWYEQRCAKVGVRVGMLRCAVQKMTCTRGRTVCSTSAAHSRSRRPGPGRG